MRKHVLKFCFSAICILLAAQTVQCQKAQTDRMHYMNDSLEFQNNVDVINVSCDISDSSFCLSVVFWNRFYKEFEAAIIANKPNVKKRICFLNNKSIQFQFSNLFLTDSLNCQYSAKLNITTRKLIGQFEMKNTIVILKDNYTGFYFCNSNDDWFAFIYSKNQMRILSSIEYINALVAPIHIKDHFIFSKMTQMHIQALHLPFILNNE